MALMVLALIFNIIFKAFYRVIHHLTRFEVPSTVYLTLDEYFHLQPYNCCYEPVTYLRLWFSGRNRSSYKRSVRIRSSMG